MSDNLISPQEMKELTGASVAAKQCEVLRKNGLRFTLRADGRPALSWESYNRQTANVVAPVTFDSGPRLQAV